jgi:cholesterol oxidase
MSEHVPNPVEPSPGISRRGVLGAAALGAAALGAGVADAGSARAATTTVSTASVPVTTTRARAVVVGTGFGGGVTALRLAKAGVSTMVLERGPRWPTGPNGSTFCRYATIDNRSSWLTDHSTLPGVTKTWTPYTGVIETLQGNGMALNCGAGVGGGSLVYHGMTLQPTKKNFAASIPQLANLYDELNRWAYPTVAKMLGISTVPSDVLKTDPYKSSRLYLDVAKQVGLDPFLVPLPIDWSFVRGELSGKYAPTYTTSDIVFGVNNGGKHSIDVTYLAAAEATGRVQVNTLHVVRDIALDASKRWVLSVDRINTGGVVQEKKTIIADAVFLNAGTAGTTRLLVKAKAKNLVPNLPDAIGTGWGNNGDRIFAWIGMNGDPGTIQGGPACVGGHDLTGAIPSTIIHAGSPAPTGGAKVMTVVGFGIVPGAGTWAYDAGTDDATLTWPTSADAALQAQIAARMQQIAATGGGQMLDTNAGAAASTWHGLGGVPVGTAVDTYGRVIGQRGLYVLDGARIPGSTGACNPSMTIAALAEHSMLNIVAQDVGHVF